MLYIFVFRLLQKFFRTFEMTSFYNTPSHEGLMSRRQTCRSGKTLPSFTLGSGMPVEKSFAKLSGATSAGFFFAFFAAVCRRRQHNARKPQRAYRYHAAMQAVGWNLPCGICKGSVCRRGGVPPLHSYCALAGLYDHSSFTLPVS